MSGLPVLRIELEGMRHSIMHMLSAHHNDVEDLVQKETKAFIEGFDFASVVRRQLGPILEQVVKDSLTAFFLRGPGRQVIEASLRGSYPPSPSQSSTAPETESDA